MNLNYQVTYTLWVLTYDQDGNKTESIFGEGMTSTEAEAHIKLLKDKGYHQFYLERENDRSTQTNAQNQKAVSHTESRQT